MKAIRSMRFLVIFSILIGMLGLGLSIVHGQSVALQNLRPNTMIQMQVDAANTDQYFIVNGSPTDPRLLVLQSNFIDSGPSVVLEDMDSHETIAAFKNVVTGMCIRLKPGNQMYLLHIQHDGATPVNAFNLWLQDTYSDNMDCPQAGFALPLAGTAGDCTMTPIGFLNTNVRSRPSVNAPIIGHITEDQPWPVLGVTADRAWLMTSTNEATGWVATSVVSSSGSCQEVPVVSQFGGSSSGSGTNSANNGGSGSDGSGGDGSNGGSGDDGIVIDISDLAGDPTLAQLAGITLNGSATAADNTQDAVITTGGDSTTLNLDLNADDGEVGIGLQDANTDQDIEIDTSAQDGDNIVDDALDTVNNLLGGL